MWVFFSEINKVSLPPQQSGCLLIPSLDLEGSAVDELETFGFGRLGAAILRRQKKAGPAFPFLGGVISVLHFPGQQFS